MPFDSFLKILPCVLCFYIFLHRSLSENADEAVSNSNNSSAVSNSSMERVLPILHLNQSAADLLIPTLTNYRLVSNTSINDIFNDNETQQMLIRYRERKKQVRILSIQRDILQKLGLTQGPNVTGRLSAEERQSLLRSFDRTMMERTVLNSTNNTSCMDSDEDTC